MKEEDVELKSSKVNIIIFLLFSMLSGFVELGNIFWTIYNDNSVLACIGLGLAYQLGNLVPVPIKLNKNVNLALIVISIFLVSIYNFINANYWILFLLIILTAMSIQNVRSIMKDSVSTTVKRAFRILGFVLAPICYNEKVLFGIIIFIFIVTVMQQNNQEFKIDKCKIKFINLVMIFHQMHYFSYVYFIIYIMIFHNIHWSKLIYGCIFALSWLTYIVMPHVFCKESYAKYFIVGHLFLTLTLICMILFRDNNLIILFWIITGFGGGTVFCIGKINGIKKFCSKNDLILSENIGHILGVLGGITIYSITDSIYAPIILSAICAFLAMIGMLTYKIKYLLK